MEKIPHQNSNPHTDEELAVLALKNPLTYDALVTRHGERLLAFISARYVRDRCSAEDVSQETFMKAYLSLGTFDPSKKFKTWLYAIAINTARSALRRRTTEDIAAYANILPSEDSPERYAEAAIERGQLDAALSCLEPNHRVPLEMHYGLGLTYKEISAELGLKLGTVKVRIFRARQQLAAHFSVPR
jgi:RNA polymerase sigma-70 factor (ECF subfamily)